VEWTGGGDVEARGIKGEGRGRKEGGEGRRRER